MSIAALNWAMEQRTDGPSAQSVLFVIADRANEHGVCRHADPDTIAQKTRQSRATVFRRLEELERAGVLCRFTKHLDDGRREYEVRLTFDHFVNYKVDRDRNIMFFALDDDKCDGEPISQSPFVAREADDDTGGSQFETQGGESQIETGSVSPVRLGESHSCDPLESPSKNPDSPQSPPLPGCDTAGSAKGASGEAPPPNDDNEVWLLQFRSAYPEPSNRPEVVASLAAALTAAERELALRGAEGAKAARAKAILEKRKRPLVDPAKFLGNPALWAEYARFAPPPPPPEIFVAFGSEEWRGRAVRAAICGARMPSPADIAGHGRGAIFHREVGPDVLALASFANESGGVDTRNWPIIEKAATGADSRAHITSEFAAWGQRIKDWTGLWPQAERIALCDAQVRCKPCWCEMPFTFKGVTTMVRGSKTGLRVPTPFPPAKGERSNSGADPPEPGLSEQGSHELQNL